MLHLLHCSIKSQKHIVDFLSSKWLSVLEVSFKSFEVQPHQNVIDKTTQTLKDKVLPSHQLRHHGSPEPKSQIKIVTCKMSVTEQGGVRFKLMPGRLNIWVSKNPSNTYGLAGLDKSPHIGLVFSRECRFLVANTYTVTVIL